MLHGRWCPQMCAGVWHRARPQQRPRVDEGDIADCIVPLKDTAQKRHSTRHLTPWHSPQTPTAPQRQTTRGENLLFCDASRTKHFDSPQPQNVPRKYQKTLKTGPGAHFFVFSVPQMFENKRRLEHFENCIFAMCTFPSGEQQILETTCFKQHAFLVRPLGVSCDFL